MGKFIRFLIAILIIAFGVVLVLGNLGFETVNVSSVWGLVFPVICIGFGLKWIINGIRRRSSIWLWGLLFLTYGTLLLLGRFEVISFVYKDIFKLWPIIIIYAGFLLLGRRRSVYFESFNKDNWKKNRKFYKKGSNFSIGDHEYNEQNWKVEPMDLSNLAGDFYLDFTKAFIPEEEIPIVINALAGDVHIIMPQDVDFSVDAIVSAGQINVAGQKVGGVGRTLHFKTKNYDTVTRKIKFKLTLKAGDIRVDQV